MGKMKTRESYELPYFLWLAFYILVFGSIFNFVVVPIVYTLLIAFAFLQPAERLYRFLAGVRPLRTLKEKERLLPLFEEVYSAALIKYPNLFKGITLYIEESMEINAFALGRSTLVITRGSIHLLNDDCLRGLISHELGHFANHDTLLNQIAYIGNLPLTLLIKLLAYLAHTWRIFNLIYRPILLINDAILMSAQRQQEYRADQFAFEIGYGDEMISALYELYAFIVEKPGSIEEQIRRTHPPITRRIEELEKM